MCFEIFLFQNKGFGKKKKKKLSFKLNSFVQVFKSRRKYVWYIFYFSLQNVIITESVLLSSLLSRLSSKYLPDKHTINFTPKMFNFNPINFPWNLKTDFLILFIFSYSTQFFQLHSEKNHNLKFFSNLFLQLLN